MRFFAQYGGQRGGARDFAPELAQDYEPGPDAEEEAVDAELDAEVPAARWEPLALLLPAGFSPRDWPGRPRRYVDGKDVGLVVASLQAPAGYPVPVRLSQIGAVVLQDEDGVLRRAAEIVRRVVTFITHPFPWPEVEALAIALRERGLHLVHARPPQKAGPQGAFDYGLTRKVTFNQSNNEMKRLEEGLAARFYDDVVTVIDGRLEPRFGQRDNQTAVVGVIKIHQARYLHSQGLKVRYALRPRQRTPAFFLNTGSFPVVSWYLRFADGLPDQGVVRVELPRGFYEGLPQGERRGYLDRLSLCLYEARCRQRDYGRAAVSLHPIVRAEESLGSLLCPMNMLINQFYRMAGL